MLTDRDRVELERVGERLRKRYRHLLMETAERNYWDRQRAMRDKRWATAERFDGQELSDEPGGDDE